MQNVTGEGVMPKKTLRGEAAVKRAVTDLLEAEKINYYRMNSGNIVLKGKNGYRAIKLNPKGTPDLLCHLKKSITPYYETPMVCWVEVKAPGKSPTDEQHAFGVAARLRGETWLVVDDVKVLKDFLKDQRCR